MIGKTLGHYKILNQLGRGGMGEVYLAEDLSLDRKVALKFLPEVFTGDPERMARFEREAKLLASLNHPNIAAIYGLEQAEGKRFLIMEYVEGETLQARISKGALPLEEALGVCRQIAEGLEAAHEKGVIHRDLKPANVMITGDEKVKILDFGLAKALLDEGQSVDSSQSPTITEAMTQPGVVLGTAAYMSPEQAKGKAVDKRADIWAFGCILYECLSGKRVFAGETVTETLAAVIRAEPSWDILPASTPQNIRFVLRRCLEKGRDRRFRDPADVQIEIEEARDISGSMTPVKKHHQWLAWSIAAIFIIACTALIVMYLNEKKPSSTELIQLPFMPSISLANDPYFALSPDGRRLAFAAIDSNNVKSIWIRELNSGEEKPLLGTESNEIHLFFWSWDSRFLAFDAGGKLQKINVFGGPPLPICDISGEISGGSWNHDDVIIFGTYGANEGIMQVSAESGVASPVTLLNPTRPETGHYSPTFLPDGRHFLYYCAAADDEYKGIRIGSLDYKPEEQSSNQILAANGFPIIYMPSQDSNQGRLLFVRDNMLMSQQFNEKRLETIGDPSLVAEQISSFADYAYFSVSSNNTLIYRRGGQSQSSHVMWLDREGNASETALQSGNFYGFSFSPDEKRAAIGWVNPTQSHTGPDVYLYHFLRGNIKRFTHGQGISSRPVWSPAGDSIIFCSNRDEGVFNLFQQPVNDDNAELICDSDTQKFPTSWSVDGRFVLYTEQDPKNRRDICVLPLEENREPIKIFNTTSDELDGRFSPDMNWIAYVSDESSIHEIYICKFSSKSGGTSFNIGDQIPVSNGGGVAPRWRGDSRELYFRSLDGKVMAVEISSDTVSQLGIPRPLFSAPPDVAELTAIMPSFPTWDVTTDGSRFLLPVPVEESSTLPFTFIINWTSLLKK